ncbi:glycosyltransferase family 4 protein [Aequorivita echinoideorum]|uniref:Glycosyltransferase family 4 protein n=1 Tax=Aequorivita echinoideorum TaxID=1549647 RepID=A0ABS5S1S0_9FLAO|nr:glycosyltransferase family 4 protein [Aequorivita echinoideorum]MBT0607159.1 glycosyltransferase family 4 protein [Aequorivita echinoideorum]
MKNFKTHLEGRDVVFSAVSVINGKRSNKVRKLISYSKYYLSISKNYLIKEFDLLYVHFLSHNAPILTLLLFFFGKKKPLVVNVHGDDIIKSKGKKIDKLNKFVLKKTDLIVVPSSYFQNIMLSNYPFLNAQKIFTSPSGGIDGNKFYNIPRPENTVPIFGMISRIDAGKGWDDFLKALHILKLKGINFKAIIAGQGLEENKMQQLIADLDLTDNVNFLGLVKQDQLVNLYNQMDIMVFPTRREAESLGLVGLEAMSCKTPVIGSNIAGLKTYIDNTKNGLLFEPGNTQELAKSIEKYLNFSKEEKNELREAAFKTAQKYEANYVIAQLNAKLEQLCTKN